MRNVAIIQARYTSERLPGKVLMPLAGRAVIDHVIERATLIPGVDTVCVAIPEGIDNQPLADAVRESDTATLVMGPEHDLTRRFAIAAAATEADAVLRLWSDSPAFDPGIAGNLLEVYMTGGIDYAYIPSDSGFPAGMECEILSRQALDTVDREANSFHDREGVHPYLRNDKARFPSFQLRSQSNRSDLNLLLDTPQDYARLEEVFRRLPPVFGLAEIESLATSAPELFAFDA